MNSPATSSSPYVKKVATTAGTPHSIHRSSGDTPASNNIFEPPALKNSPDPELLSLIRSSQSLPGFYNPPLDIGDIDHSFLFQPTLPSVEPLPLSPEDHRDYALERVRHQTLSHYLVPAPQVGTPLTPLDEDLHAARDRRSQISIFDLDSDPDFIDQSRLDELEREMATYLEQNAWRTNPMLTQPAEPDSLFCALAEDAAHSYLPPQPDLIGLGEIAHQIQMEEDAAGIDTRDPWNENLDPSQETGGYHPFDASLLAQDVNSGAIPSGHRLTGIGQMTYDASDFGPGFFAGGGDTLRHTDRTLTTYPLCDGVTVSTSILLGVTGLFAPLAAVSGAVLGPWLKSKAGPDTLMRSPFTDKSSLRRSRRFFHAAVIASSLLGSAASFWMNDFNLRSAYIFNEKLLSRIDQFLSPAHPSADIRD